MGAGDTGGSAPPPPDVASDVFGDRLDLARAYADRLAGAGVTRGLIGPRETGRLWERHLLNCAVVGDVLPADGEVADVGSGAGLPGLVLAIARPDLRLVLVEPLLRRTRFLEEIVSELGLIGVEVLRSRAEDLRGRRFDVTTSRAVAPLPRLAEWCLPLTRAGGTMVAIKGERADVEVAELRPEAWLRVGASTPEVVRVGVGDQPPVALVRVVRERETDVRLSGHDRSGPGAPRRRRGRPRR